MKGSSLFSFSCKDQKGKGEYDDTEQKEEDDQKYENEKGNNDFGHNLSLRGL
jgi:hypothetical protein